MAKLHEWQKIRKAKKGWVYVTGKARTVNAWIGTPKQSYLTQKRTLRLKRDVIYEVAHVNPRREYLWIRNDDHVLAIKFEDARLSGGVFPDRLRAEVAKQSNALR